MVMAYSGLYGRNRLLATFDHAAMSSLTPHLKNSHLKQGVVIQEAGDLIEQVYFPQSGMISLLAVMLAGNGVETATIGREGAVGSMSAFGGRRATGRAVIQLEGDFTSVGVQHFQTALRHSPAAREIVSRYNDAQITLIYQVAGCNALHAVTTRLCRWLLQTRDRSESDVIQLTHEFLSEMLGVQRSTVTLVARELQTLGAIQYRRGRIEIVDRALLEERACECYNTGRRIIDRVFDQDTP